MTSSRPICARLTLCSELGAPSRQRLLRELAFATRSFHHGLILRGRHLAWPAHHEVGEPLLRGSQRAPRIGAFVRVASATLSRRDFVEDKCSTSDQSIERKWDGFGRRPGKRQDEVQPSRASRGVVQRLAFGQRAKHQAQVVPPGGLDNGCHAQGGAAVSDGGQGESQTRLCFGIQGM